MAIIETTCSHCHRQSQIRLMTRIADGPPLGGQHVRTAWARHFSTPSLSVAQAALAMRLKKASELRKLLASNSVEGSKTVLSGQIAALERPKLGNPSLTSFAGKCSFADCGGPMLFIGSVTAPYDEIDPDSEEWMNVHLPMGTGAAFEAAAQYPSPSGLTVHHTWPSVARDHLPELAEDLARKRNPARILSGARTVLDTVLQDLLKDEMPNGRGKAIELLRTKGVVTNSIADWAKKLWRDGSDASHEGSGDAAIASAHLEFLKVLLHVAYVLPHDIERLKAKDDFEALLG